MGDWEYYFSQRNRWDGQKLYEQGAVQNYKQVDENTITAKVYDKPPAYISIRSLRNGQYDMHCSCETRTGRRYCKHLAAVLFFHDAQKTILDAPLFDENKRNEYFFNLGKITKNLRSNANVIEEAMSILEDQEIKLDKVEVNEDYDYYRMKEEKTLTAMGHIVGRGTRVYVDMNQNEMIEMGAGWDRWYRQGMYGYNEISPYCIALLYLLDDYIKKFDPGDNTDEAGMTLLQNFAMYRVNQQKIEEDGKSKVVVLTPKLESAKGALILSFRIGIDKKYVVKNLEQLITIKNNNGVYPLGKNNEILFAKETFTDQSQKYFDFMQNLYNEKRASVENAYERDDEIGIPFFKGSDIFLYGRSLDDFYELAEGQILEHKVNTADENLNSSTLKIGGSPLRVNMNIVSIGKEGHPCDLKVQMSYPFFYRGAKQMYFESKGYFSPLSKEDEEAVKPFVKSLGFSSGTFTIGHKNLSEFIYRILPYLRENPIFQIDDTNLKESQLPEEAKFKIYLDIEDGNVLCHGDVSYGDKTSYLKPLDEKDFPLAKYRDLTAEEDAMKVIEKYFEYFDAEKKQWNMEKADDPLYQLLNEGIPELKAYGEVVGTDAFSRVRIRKTRPFQLGVSLQNGLMEIELINNEISEEDLLKILESYRQKKKFHKLSNGEFLSIEQDETLETLEELMRTLNVSIEDFTNGKLDQPLYRALYVNKILEEHDAIAFERDKNFKGLIRNIKTVKDTDFEIAKEVKEHLREYQIYGVQWMRTLTENGFGGILADDMGLGKTIQMIALLDSTKEESKDPAIVITPASVVYNWEEEFHRFAPSMNITVLAGTKAERKEKLQKAENTNVFIVSYDTAKRDVALLREKKFSYEILDEGQFIKNIKADVTKAVKILNATKRFVLTGTPIENRLSELWSIFDFLMPGFLFTYEQFRQRFELAITKDKDSEQTEALKKMVSPFILRRLKKDVLKDLPEKIEEVRFARFDDKQRELYDGQLVHMRRTLAISSGKDSKIKIFAELMRLRQICCDPSLIAENYNGKSAKTEACMDLVKSAIDGGHRILLFSQFTSMLEILEGKLKESNISYYKITGSTSKEERMRLVHAFNDSNEIPVFLVSLKAGGTGLNLTGADVVIHYDPWWNLAAQNQATDRAHRIGQKNTVTVYKLIIKDSVEEKILEIQDKKKDLAEAVLNGETTLLSAFSTEELMELIS